MKNCFMAGSIKPFPKRAHINLPGSPVFRHAAFLFFLVISVHTSAQSKWAYEQYGYFHQTDEAAFVPILRFETKNNWHLEMRYNYEDAQTLSFFGGKTFTGGKDLQYIITPMVGISTGNFTGLSFGTNTELTWKKLYCWAQSQYSKATKKNTADFFFNWSELGYEVSDHFFTGLAMQYTRQIGENNFEPGLLAGLSFKNVSFPFYVFSPFHSDSYFVLGLNYELVMKKSNTKKITPPY